MFDDHEISHDGKVVEASGDKKLRLMLWSKTDMMIEYFSKMLAQAGEAK